MSTDTLAVAIAADSSRRARWPRRRLLLALVLAAFVLRVGVMLGTRAYTFPPTSPITDPSHQGWFFGYEVGRVARSIAAGEGFASPFHGATGPTAWLAPLYPYLLAGVFRLFGTYTHAAGLVILTLNSLFAALTCVPLLLLGERLLSRKVALWAAWLWAVLPTFFWYAVAWAWETSLSTLLLLTVLWLTLRLEGDRRAWFAWGLLWGAIALTNPSMLAMMPFTLLWAWVNPHLPTPGMDAPAGRCGAPARGRRLQNAALAVAVMALTIVPWTLRNHRVFGQWMLVRGNFWAELAYCNGEQARGFWMGWMHPGINDAELSRYRELGEVRYMAAKKELVSGFIRRRPAFFLELTLRRAVMFWCGVPENRSEDLSAHEVMVKQWRTIGFSALAWIGLVVMLRRRAAGAWFLAPAMFVYPLLYYVTNPFARFRHPIEPIMLLLAVYAVAASREPGVSSDKPAMARAAQPSGLAARG